MKPSDAPGTRRLVLRPGTHVLRRSATELQVGLDPERAIVVPDRPEVRALLRRLARPAEDHSWESYDGRTFTALADAGLLIDVDVLLPLAPAPPRPGDTATGKPMGMSRAAAAALALEAGDQSAELLRCRSNLQVDVLTCGSTEAVPVAEQVLALLSSAATRPRLLPHGRPPAEEARTQSPPGRSQVCWSPSASLPASAWTPGCAPGRRTSCSGSPRGCRRGPLRPSR